MDNINNLLNNKVQENGISKKILSFKKEMEDYENHIYITYLIIQTPLGTYEFDVFATYKTLERTLEELNKIKDSDDSTFNLIQSTVNNFNFITNEINNEKIRDFKEKLYFIGKQYDMKKLLPKESFINDIRLGIYHDTKFLGFLIEKRNVF